MRTKKTIVFVVMMGLCAAAVFAQNKGSLRQLAEYLNVEARARTVQTAVEAAGNRNALNAYKKKDYAGVIAALEQQRLNERAAAETAEAKVKAEQAQAEAEAWRQEVRAAEAQARGLNGGGGRVQNLLKQAQTMDSQTRMQRAALAAYWQENGAACLAELQAVKDWIAAEPERQAEQQAAEKKAAEEKAAALAAANNAGVTAADFVYDAARDGKGVVIKGYKGAATIVNIPAVIEGFPVREIENGVFKGNKNISSVTIPDSVTGLGLSMFEDCTNLVSVTLPRNLTAIPGDYWRDTGMFNGCTSLTAIALPAGLQSIGHRAFRGCTSLTAITLPAGLRYIEAGAFARCTGLTAITFPAGLESIGDNAFYGCTGLTAVTLPAGLRSIGGGAFGDCTSLAALTINANIDLSGGCFSGCPITTVNIGPRVTRIRGAAAMPQDKLSLAAKAALNKLDN
ncbi:MAG: leucine-rich repeat domain-containing protein [Treponema sp.]|jgi:hypothetical protein|nr:leucine-rich repeat domain-containing protein [Treponema sp.]